MTYPEQKQNKYVYY